MDRPPSSASGAAPSPLVRLGVRILLLVLVPGIMAYAWAVSAVVRGYPGMAELPADCALVFGAAVRVTRGADGTLNTAAAGPGIQRRVATAVRLYKERSVRFLVFSGGYGDRRRASEAEVMAGYAESLGLPASAYRLEDRARSTLENIRFSQPLLSACRTTVAVSDRYHLRRIQLLARKLGWETLWTYPADRHADPLFEARAVLREALGLIWYNIAL